MNLIEEIKQCGVLPVIKITDPSQVTPLGNALLEGGIHIAEVTYRSEYAGEAIQTFSKIPGMIAGAGTVTNMEQFENAMESGAEFIISPGIDVNIAEACKQRNVPYFPGVTSPTEIQTALQFDLSVLKFFPAELSGGVSMLKAFHAVYPDISFIPTGGISASNVSEYLQNSFVLACGASSIVPTREIEEGRWSEVTHLCQEMKGILEAL